MPYIQHRSRKRAKHNRFRVSRPPLTYAGLGVGQRTRNPIHAQAVNAHILDRRLAQSSQYTGIARSGRHDIGDAYALHSPRPGLPWRLSPLAQPQEDRRPHIRHLHPLHHHVANHSPIHRLQRQPRIAMPVAQAALPQSAYHFHIPHADLLKISVSLRA
jgi:hypothetical protein